MNPQNVPLEKIPVGFKLQPLNEVGQHNGRCHMWCAPHQRFDLINHAHGCDPNRTYIVPETPPTI